MAKNDKASEKADVKRKDSFKSKLSQNKNIENDTSRKSIKSGTSINQLNNGIFKEMLKKQENIEVNSNNATNMNLDTKKRAPQIKLVLPENTSINVLNDSKNVDEKIGNESRNNKSASNDFDLFQKKNDTLKNSLPNEDKSINEFKTSFNSTLLNNQDEENAKSIKNDLKCLSTPKYQTHNTHLNNVSIDAEKKIETMESNSDLFGFGIKNNELNIEETNYDNLKARDNNSNKVSIDTDNNSIFGNDKHDENNIIKSIDEKSEKSNLKKSSNAVEIDNKIDSKSTISKQSNKELISVKENKVENPKVSIVKDQKDNKEYRDNKSIISKKSTTKLEVIPEKAKENNISKQSKKDLIKIDDKIKDNQSAISKKSNVESIKNEEVKKLNLKDISSELSDVKEKEQTSKRSDKRQQTTLINNKNSLVEGLGKKMGLNFGADKDKDETKKRKIIKHVKDDPEKKIIEEVEEPKKEETYLYKLKTNQELYQTYTKKFCNNYKISNIKECQLSLKSERQLSENEIFNIVNSYIESANIKQLEQLDESIKRKIKMIEEIDNVRF